MLSHGAGVIVVHCRACGKSWESWYYGQGMLCKECSKDYQEAVEQWRAENGNRQPIDYPPFSVWDKFIRSKSEQGEDPV